MNNNFFAGKKALITGGAGFIGSNLARLLVGRGAAVTVLDSLVPEGGGNRFNLSGLDDKIAVHTSDIRDESAMNQFIQGQDFLFNLAGQTSHVDSMSDPLKDLEVNARAQLLILEACRKYNPGIKIVFTSTRQIYGKPLYLPVDEKHPLTPVDVNGINKIAGEMYHSLYNNLYGIRACTLRLTNTYGPRLRVKDTRQMFLGFWIRLLIEGKPIPIYGDGAQIRDFNYVDDVVEALLLAAASEASNGQAFNVGDASPICLLDLAQLLVEINGGGEYHLVPFPPDRKNIDIGDYYADSTKIKKLLRWTPEVPLRQGLTLTLDYYRKHHDNYW